MASKAAPTALFLIINILFFTLDTSGCPPSPPPPSHSPPPPSHPPPPPSHSPPPPSHSPPPPSHPPPPPSHSPPPPSHSPPPPSHSPTPPSHSPPPPSHSPPPPSPSPPPPSPTTESCPRDALKFGVCATVLNSHLLNITLGTPAKTPCCSLIQGLLDLEVAVCFCTALKADILGINLNLPISLSLLVGYCGKSVPSGFQCS